MPVISVIAYPASESSVKRDADSMIEVGGYAVPGGANGPVTRVEVSADDGKSWIDAELISHPEEGKWSWKLWKARLGIDVGPNSKILSKASDASGSTQPRVSEWNLRGVCYSGYGEVNSLQIE